MVRGGGGCPDELSVAASSQSPHSRERGLGLQSQGLHTGRAQVNTRRLSAGVATCLSLLSCLEGCNCDGLVLFVPGRMTVSVKSLGRMMDICAVYVSIDKDKDSEDADDDDNGFVKCMSVHRYNKVDEEDDCDDKYMCSICQNIEQR